MSSPAEFRARHIGRAALAALRAGPARVFAAFERSCYVETPAGIACLGGPEIGRGPLNVIVEGQFRVRDGFLDIDTRRAEIWLAPRVACEQVPLAQFPALTRPWRDHLEAQAFLGWLAMGGAAPGEANALIGLGPGLTPAGDDFVGGAMIALRAAGKIALADRVAGWALPLAKERTNRISRTHLQCAAAGEGHEALHDFLRTFSEEHLGRLGRIGHSSGLDAAAGAVLALNVNIHANRRSAQALAGRSSAHLAHLRRT